MAVEVCPLAEGAAERLGFFPRDIEKNVAPASGEEVDAQLPLSFVVFDAGDHGGRHLGFLTGLSA
jgi:hypothetical protein